MVAPPQSTPPTEGERVTVTGTFRPSLPNNEQRRTEWSDRPAIVADAVQASGGRESVQNASGSEHNQSDSQVQVVTAGDVAAHPDKYDGQTVEVRSQVIQAYDGRTFALNEDRPLAGRDVLVLVPRARLTVPEGRIVTVRGKVRPLNLSNFQHDYPWFTPEMRDTVQSASGPDSHRPVIIAESVRTNSGREYVQNSDWSRNVGSAGSATRGGSGRGSDRE